MGDEWKLPVESTQKAKAAGAREKSKTAETVHETNDTYGSQWESWEWWKSRDVKTNPKRVTQDDWKEWKPHLSEGRAQPSGASRAVQQKCEGPEWKPTLSSASKPSATSLPPSSQPGPAQMQPPSSLPQVQ